MYLRFICFWWLHFIYLLSATYKKELVYMDCNLFKLLGGVCLSCLILTSCSTNPSYEDQISNILVYEEGVGEYTNDQVEKVFKLIAENPNTIDYDFSNKVPMSVITSDDGMVRAYVIEKLNFGGYPSTGFETSTLIQYKVGNDIYTTRLGEDFPIVKSIAYLSDNHYLVIDSWRFIAECEHYHNRARVFEIVEPEFKIRSNIFRDGESNVSEIEIHWNDDDCFDDSTPNYHKLQEDLIDETNTDFELGILYNGYFKYLYIPNTIVTPQRYEVMDGTFRCFSWDNEYFIDCTHMSPLEIMNKDYFIRIEQNLDGSCTYRCWDGGVKIGKPSLTIRNGRRQVWDFGSLEDYNKWISLDESFPLGEQYTFENNGYTYRYMKGWYKGHAYNDLEVYNSNDDLIYSGQFKHVE